MCEAPATSVSKRKGVWLRDGRYRRNAVTSGVTTNGEGTAADHKAGTHTG